MTQRKSYKKRVLDYEMGHLVKSPCRECATRHQFPGCATTCSILDRIQSYLAQSISTARPIPGWEPLLVQLEEWRSK